MEPIGSEKNFESIEVTKKLKGDLPSRSLIDVLEDLPVKDKSVTLVTEQNTTLDASKDDGIQKSRDSNEEELDSPDLKVQKTLQNNISRGMKRIQSFGVTLDRDVRHEQLTQLIAAKLREGELMIELNSKNAWEKISEASNWTVHTRTAGQIFWIRNEVKISCSYAIAKELLIEYRKKRQVNTDTNEPSPLEKISNICSINYERSTSLEPTDYLILRLERQAKEGCFKIAEMSIEDKRCPVIPGIKRGHLELRYWHLAPDEENEKRCKLWIVECVKLKTKGDETEMKTAMDRNKNLIQKVLNVKV